MTAHECKKHLIGYWLFRRNADCATAEIEVIGSSRADVLVLLGNKTIECEIKMDKGDLKNELEIIKKSFNRADERNLFFKDLRSKKPSKQYKHDFLSNLFFDFYVPNQGKQIIPNKYYIAVPGPLIEYAGQELLKLPYGLIQLDDSFWRIKVVKSSKNLHNREFNDYLSLMRRLSTENYNLR